MENNERKGLMIKEIWRKTLVGFIPILFIILMILAALYLVALIVPDNISVGTAETIGYIVIAAIVIFALFAILYIKYSDMQRDELLVQHEVDKRKITELEEKLKEIKNRR